MTHHPFGHPPPGEPFGESQFSSNGRFDRSMFHSNLPPPMNSIGAAQFMAMNNPTTLSRTTGLPNMGTMPLPGSSPEALLDMLKQLKHLQGLHKNQDIENGSIAKRPRFDDSLYQKDDDNELKENQNDEVLNLSQSHSEHQDDSIKSHSDIGETDIGPSEDGEDYDDKLNTNKEESESGPIFEAEKMRSSLNLKSEAELKSKSGPILEVGKLNSMLHMMTNICSLINTAIETAKMEEKQLLKQKNGEYPENDKPHIAQLPHHRCLKNIQHIIQWCQLGNIPR